MVEWKAQEDVPEVWRHDGHTLQMFRLVDRGYQQIESSIELPGLTATRINAILSDRDTVGETKLIQRFHREV